MFYTISTSFKGPHCEECAPNHYGDDCRRCKCDPRGTMEGSVCAGSCQCKVNVEGETCSECATGYYDLDKSNPEGCSRCWCSQVSDNCHSAKLQTLAFETLNDWKLTDIQREQSVAVALDAEQKRLIFGNELDEVEAIYWQAPAGYLGNRLTSYGARLQLHLSWVVMRGDIGEADYGTQCHPMWQEWTQDCLCRRVLREPRAGPQRHTDGGGLVPCAARSEGHQDPIKAR